MAFQDITEFLEPLELPMRGKTYTIPPMTLEAGLRLRPLLSGETPEDLTDEEVVKLTLGATHREMVADGVPEAWIQRAILVAMAEFQSGRVAAELIWKTGGDPKAVQAEVRKTTNRAQRRSKRTAAASTTS
ncbi:hypothetical protein GCM10027568_10990 [Humibacter soli]